MKTSFVISGSMRSGTSSLYHYLSQHPLICMGAKEVNGFFSQNHLFDKGYPNTNLYDSQFKSLSEKSVKGEICLDYMYRPTCMSRLKIYNPDIKFISILRNPAERAYSHWQLNVNNGIEKLPFNKVIEKEQEQLLTIEEDQSAQSRSYLSRGMYSDQIKNLLQYFDPHQLLFIRNEDLKDDTEVVIYQTLQFLGLPYLEVDRTPKNLGDYQQSMRQEDYNNLTKIFERDIHEIEKLLDWNCNDWIRPLTINRPMMDYILS